MISAQVVSRIPGKETDHSRGHWPSEAFVHLVIGARMLEEYGYSHTVYVDADGEVEEISASGGFLCLHKSGLAWSQQPQVPVPV